MTHDLADHAQSAHYVTLLVSISNTVSAHDRLYEGYYRVHIEHQPHPGALASTAIALVMSRITLLNPEIILLRVHTTSGIEITERCHDVFEHHAGRHCQMLRVPEPALVF